MPFYKRNHSSGDYNIEEKVTQTSVITYFQSVRRKIARMSYENFIKTLQQ